MTIFRDQDEFVARIRGVSDAGARSVVRQAFDQLWLIRGQLAASRTWHPIEIVARDIAYALPVPDEVA